MPKSPDRMDNELLHLFDNYVLDAARGRLLHAGQPIHLRPQAYKLLKYLAEHRGRLVSKDQLIEEVWERRAVTDDSLVQCLRDVRLALGETGSRYLRNERGRGYIFDPPLDEQSEQIDIVRVVVEEEDTQEVDVPKVLLPARVERPRRTLVIVVACLAVVVLVAAYYLVSQDRKNTENAVAVRSLAVLPFKPLVAEGHEEVLEVGMTDTLIAKLGNIKEVTVRPLSAVRRYGSVEQDPFAAGRQLGVEAVLDGTIQRSGDRVGVTVRLVRVADGRQLWDGRFDAPFTDIFSVQDAISERVAAALKPKLTSAEEQKLAKRYTENIEAYQLYLRGRHHALKRTLPETQKAISYFQQAIAIDPSYALAYSGLADAHISSLAAAQPPNEFLTQARAAAQKAIELDGTLADAHAELGFVIFWRDWDWGASEKQFKQALELDPNSSTAHLLYAHLLSNTGRHDEALAEAKRARDLDPLNLRTNALEAQFLIHAGRTDEALARLREILEIEPNYLLARLYASSAYIEKGMYPEAIGEARRAIEISETKSSLAQAFLGYALAKSSRETEARSVLQGLLKSSADHYVPPNDMALIYNGLGEHDKALTWLERAYAARSTGMVFLKVEPKWNNLRSDARFQELLKRVGLPA